MTAGTILTQGTELFTVDALSSSVAAVLKMACPTGITGLGGAKDQIEDTCLDNTTDKTFKPGLGNPGQVTVPLTVTGTLDAPSVGVDLSQTLQRAATNELQRQAEDALKNLLRRKK